MARASIVLLALVAALLGADRVLARRERSRRDRDPAVERLVAPERAGQGKVAAITIEIGGKELFYAHKNGLWRSREGHGAVCRAAAFRDLLAGFFDARGVLRAQNDAQVNESAEDAVSYGFGAGNSLTVTFHGPKVLAAPDRDVLFTFEVGQTFAEGPRGRSFVREKGSDRILEIDRDPRRLLDLPMGSLLPPLVDTRLLAGCLSEEFRGFREFKIETPGGGSVRVAIDERVHEDAAHEGGAREGEPAAWFLDRGKGREAFPGWRVGGYIGLWLRGRFAETESPSRAGELGFDPPAAIVHVTPEGSAPIELWISQLDDRHRTRAWNKTSNVVMVVPGPWQPLLAPSAEMFLDTGRPNPWEEWLRKP